MTGSLVPATPEELLAALDPEQRQAAEELRGPVRVLAGAGTGKTRAITHRIAYGVATGTYSPDRVLALTFTARAAGEMRTRLRHLGAGPVQSVTFHSAALKQLGYFWPQVVGGQTPRILEKKSRALAEAANVAGTKVDTATIRDLATEVEWRKVSNLTLAAYEVRAHGRSMPGGLAVSQVMAIQQAYENLKDERAQIDFEDVLLLTAGMIESEPAVAMEVRERYRFFVVDEYQDVSPLQHHLLNLWLGDRQDLCVVGDASQTIYSFTGATSDYLLEFPSAFPDATLVRLETNYRSTGPIVTAANALMRDRAGALQLTAQTANGPAPDVSTYPNDAAEARGVAARIAGEIASGTKPEDIAVLYRINVQGAALEQALSDEGINYLVHGATRFFDLPEVKQAILALRGASVSISGEPLFKSVSDVLRSLGWTQTAPDTLGAVRAKWEALNALMVLADEARTGMSFRAFTDELMARQEARHEPTMHAVTLASVHSAKGLEWESVHIIGMSEGLIPISYATGIESIAEERRLVYVAVTRARKRLSVSWSEQGSQRAGSRSVSRFVAELGMRIPAGGGKSRVSSGQ
ncbi:ATP-dependent DNA helicase UvrD2 [Alpinimonas psychrophila]|uniref:DNA 3'-5' helicase n=1 Tax=Alpinimonas psychrophila TaxID=748908 RepID=A0A7W3JS23_9MICO|nr:ATP-dependent helicase [Alpinimonas psychrophila]MBA8828204.1 DNA helicase-2/ATP-dependent DNA helicase PcrA [Alpinimonas psychrophila]